VRTHLLGTAVYLIAACGVLPALGSPAAALTLPPSAMAARAPAQDPDLSTAPRITVADLKKLQADGNVVVVDVRDAESYKAGHIPGAVSIPLDQLASHVAGLREAKTPIVTYCA
jgi:3-mercaptopyruvate sulfurtransferase SseA